MSDIGPTASAFDLGSCQVTVWTPDEEVSGGKIFRGLFPSWASRFDDEPIIYPTVDGLPREIPRITLQSKSREWRCEIASARVNLFWNCRESARATEDVRFVEQAINLIRDYVSFTKARVGRVAFLRTVYARHESPGRFLASHFCKERWLAIPLNRPENFELHAHKRFALAGKWQVNSWLRSKTGRVALKDEGFAAVVVEQDLNSLAEEEATRDFPQEEISDYFAVAASEAKNVLELYYPEEDR